MIDCGNRAAQNDSIERKKIFRHTSRKKGFTISISMVDNCWNDKKWDRGSCTRSVNLLLWLLVVVLLFRFKHTTQPFADPPKYDKCVWCTTICIIERSTCDLCVARRTFSEYEITIKPSSTTCSPNQLAKLKFNLHQMLCNWDWRQDGFELISLKKHLIPKTHYHDTLSSFSNALSTPFYSKQPNKTVSLSTPMCALRGH